MKRELKDAIRNAIQIAEDLQYPADVMRRIAKAETQVQITNIMAEARRATA